MKVLKRSGLPQQFDMNKIVKIVEFATKEFDLDIKEFLSDIQSFVKDNMATKDIFSYLIVQSLKYTDIKNPDWKNVAGRLQMMEMIKKVSIGRDKTVPEIYDNFFEHLKLGVEKDIYSDAILKKYSKEEIDLASKYIKPEYDFIYDYAGVNLLMNRYLCEGYDGIFELPQEMFLIISLLLEQDTEKSIRLYNVKDTYEKIANKKISLATPFLMNLRRPNGNLSSCFITVMDDNRDSIFYVIDQISSISKHGGGVGCNVSRVRSKGARIRGVANASGGVVPWIRIINDTAVAVNQQGKRKGAVTVSLDSWHLDIEDFLELRTENGDQRMKAYDIFPQIIFSDLFMKKVEEDKDWLLVDPHEIRSKYGVELGDLWGSEFSKFYSNLYIDARSGKLEMFKFIAAKDLMKRVMKSQVETGMPYIAFKDTLNKYNPNKHDGVILATNLCTESHSNIRPTKFLGRRIENGRIITEVEDGMVHVCNLVSINLSNVDGDEELSDICNTSVRILDNAIDFTNVPILEGTMHNRHYRTIGVGAMGLADMLAKNNILYTESAKFVDDLFEKMAIYNIRASISIAEQKGTFDAYKGSDWDKGIILGKNEEWFMENSEKSGEWKEIFANLKKYGIRNSQLSAIAPNTSTSLIHGCTASILPVYSKFFIESHANGSIPNCPPFIKQKFWHYQENRNIDQRVLVDVFAHINKWVDTGISMELIYNLNNNIGAKEIYRTIIDAWKKEIKTIYYTRTIQKDSSLSAKEECVSCAG